MNDQDFKSEVIDRLARIETKLEGFNDKIKYNRALMALLFSGIIGIVIKISLGG
jgi:hypothetical protein